MADLTYGTTPDGRKVYDNAATVVCLLIRVDGKLLAVRRNHEPGTGKLGLPGGYQMYGETWQEAGARELKEETGYTVEPSRLFLWNFATDEFNNNLVIACATVEASGVANPDPAEVQELVYLTEAGESDEWAFPRHHCAAFLDLSDDTIRFEPQA